MASNNRSLITAQNALLTTAGVGLACLLLRHRTRILERLRYAMNFRNPLRHKHIEIIETVDDCQRVVKTLKKHCVDFKVLGFDCEWVTVGGTRRPTALLQLSSQQGLCALFRLCILQQIPKSLRELLEDDEVIKVGVAPQDDAQKLAHDFGVGVASTFDLRFLAAMTGYKTEGLAKLSKALLNIHMDKHWRLVCSNWEAKKLNEKQLHYAADDALVAVEIFKKLASHLEPRNFWQFRGRNFSTLKMRLEPFFDVRFKDGLLNLSNKNHAKTLSKTEKQGINDWKARKTQTRGISTRSKTLYDNCLLEAPDGELLCTIDRKKAKWYLDQQLGEEVKSEPFTVRLNFEPAGRAVGEVGRYYQTPKENQCVVCGWRDAYIRKNVVPREYRKHFPVVMKSHTSHDVLLLCPHCHQLSNISDLKIRSKLAKMCDAPFTHEEGAVKQIELPELRRLKSAARALLINGDKIPAARKAELKQVVLDHYANEKELTLELLEEASSVETTLNNEGYCQHGEKVVVKFQTELGGLIELEKMWREHFLHTMKPKFLPQLWNVNHNANRLEIRAQEGRVENDDLILAGLQPHAGNEALPATDDLADSELLESYVKV